MIKGETVKLVVQTQTGTDGFGQPVYTESLEEVDDVLVGSPSTDAAVSELNLNGKHLVFVLGIPKGDSHNWKDRTIVIRGQRFKTYGFPLTQTEENVPGRWNTQVKVEAYE